MRRRSRHHSQRPSDRSQSRKPTEQRQQHSFVYGYHAIEQLVINSPERIKKISLQSGREDERSRKMEKLCREHGINVFWETPEVLNKKFPKLNHQGFVSEIIPRSVHSEVFLENLLVDTENPFLLILDQVQDPHNLGAILRSAAAAGVHAVIAPKRNACGLTAAVRKVAVGAAEIVPYVQVTNLARCLRFLQEQGLHCVGLAGEAEHNLFASNVSSPLALVMGNEAKGLRRLTREHCDELVKIPMSSAIESLNVSVATGICLFHYSSQR